MERPSIIQIARNLAAGDDRASLGAAAAWDQAFLSSYLTGAPYGAQKTTLQNGEQLGFVGRLAGRPYYDQDWNVNIGLSGETVFHPNINASGTQFGTEETETFQDRPELAIDMNNLISTGALSARGANAFGGGTGISWRNFLVQGEYYKIDVDQLVAPNKPNPVLGLQRRLRRGRLGHYRRAHPLHCRGSRVFQTSGGRALHSSRRRHRRVGSLPRDIASQSLNSNVIPGVAQSVTGGVNGGFQQVAGARRRSAGIRTTGFDCICRANTSMSTG